jgi:hypothetical protein
VVLWLAVASVFTSSAPRMCGTAHRQVQPGAVQAPHPLLRMAATVTAVLQHPPLAVEGLMRPLGLADRTLRARHNLQRPSLRLAAAPTAAPLVRTRPLMELAKMLTAPVMMTVVQQVARRKSPQRQLVALTLQVGKRGSMYRPSPVAQSTQPPCSLHQRPLSLINTIAMRVLQPSN